LTWQSLFKSTGWGGGGREGGREEVYVRMRGGLEMERGRGWGASIGVKKLTVAGLHVPVDDARRVEEVEGLQELVDDVLLVDLLQDTRTDDCVEVCLHKVKHKVDVPVILSPALGRGGGVGWGWGCGYELSVALSRRARGRDGSWEPMIYLMPPPNPPPTTPQTLLTHRMMFRRRMMLSCPASSCKYMTSRKVRWASVLLRKASKHFFRATTERVVLSTAFHTIP
jgi:hypothetical protein